MLKRLRKQVAPALQPMNQLTLSADALRHNYHFLQLLHPGDGVFPVLKSNAYGHGLKQVATILKSVEPPYICVDSFPEYQIVRDYAGVKSLVIGETLPENYKQFGRDATFCVYNIATIKTLAALGKPVTIHLFLNTGMNREGLQREQLGTVLDIILQSKSITVEGVMSHFANADEDDASFNEVQIAMFKRLCSQIEDRLGPVHWKHIGNSAGTALMHDEYFNAWRTGLALYGYSPFSNQNMEGVIFAPLKPALTLTSTVIAMQRVDPGAGVSYGLRWKADQTCKTATIPFGYCEGLDRRLTGADWPVKIGDKHYPLIGSICMNISCLEANDTVAVGDRVTIIASDRDAPNSLVAMANKLGTIPYEVLVKLSPTIRRTVES